MSSGACRALAATLLTLVATVGLTLPVAAETESLNESSDVTYTVNPATGVVDVDMIFTLAGANPNRAVPAGVWETPIVVEETAKPRLSSGFSVDHYEDLPGLWRAMYVKHPRIPEGGRRNLRVRYKLNASVDQESRREITPARVDPGYVYVCVPGQDTDTGAIKLEISRGGSQFEPIDQSGTILDNNNAGGLQSDFVTRPRDLFTCIEATREDRLKTSEFPGPDGRTITLQAWPDLDGWLFAAEGNGEPALDEISEFLGLPIPDDGPVIIRQAPPREIGGYASDHDTPGIVQLDENGGVDAPEHELAHVWFGTDNIREQWLREGLAEWTASSIRGAACPAVDADTTGVELRDWKVVQPFSNPDTIDQLIEDQQAAACGIVSAMADRMSAEQWHEVLGSLLNGETKYIGSSGPGAAATTAVDYREWLDAVDERGLVPARLSDPAYDGTVAGLDLDYAQNLIDEFGADVDAGDLAARSEARARYHQFLIDSPIGAPLAVREAMDDWEFRRANDALDKSNEVLAALNEADALLPTAGLIPFIQPAFEGARTDDALDEVLGQTLSLLDSASGVSEPLNELLTSSPQGWDRLPVVINDAITGQRFDDIIAAIRPALEFVQDISAANQALPQAGLLDTYKTRYETTASLSKLDELAEEMGDVRSQAERTAAALSELNASVGEWQIPAAVTQPIDSGQLSAGFTIVNDARAVVKAARDADIALPEYDLSSDIKARFEAVQTAGEMATLRAEAELMRDQAQAIGGALSALKAKAPEWQLPSILETPIEERDFETAARLAAIAQSWIDDAYEANTKLPAMNAIDRAQQDFESAATEADLESGALRAENWNIAADRVAEAQVAIAKPRDLLADLGLWGTDLQPVLDEAVQAAVEGDSQTAFNRAATVINSVNSASSDGGLRLAGVIFMGVAVVGVLGLWLMLRREAGPPWARQTKPHWVDDKKDRKLLGRGKKSDKDKGKKDKSNKAKQYR